MKATNNNLFKLRRYFNIIGLSSTVIAASLLVLFYRVAATSDLVELGERNNLLLAKTVLNSVKSELIEFIKIDKEININSKRKYQLPANLKKAIQDTMANTTVTRIKIFNKNGTVLFSTKTSQIGKSQPNSKQFKSAMDGRIASKLIYHDTFNIFSEKTDDANLVQSYLPIRLNVTSPIHGVFEVYTDVNFIVDRVERTEAIILLGVFIILLLLYGFQVVIVRNSFHTVEQQQSVIDDKTRTLELLSAQMLNSQEREKKKLSKLLHEDLTQTLSIIKTNIEVENSATENKPLSESIELLHQTIQKLRSLAIDLRPPSLDDFGLIKTLDFLCKEYNALYPRLKITTFYDFDESKIPASIKTLIYRVTQEAMARSSNNSLSFDVYLTLTVKDDFGIITILIEDNENNLDDSSITYSAMKKRTILSGGTFNIKRNSQGGTIATSSWPY